MTIPSQDGVCGQHCVSMLAAVPLSDVVGLMGKGKASFSQTGRAQYRAHDKD